MRNVVTDDVRDYVREHWKLILLSIMAAVVCYGFLVFNDNIRIDTEELLNNPGTSLGWLTIGRFGLVFLKKVLGLVVHSVTKSGVLFFVFFLLGVHLLTFAIYRFSGRREYPYWIFVLLYSTSNIWAYQIYFSVQQAEVACAMFLLVVAAVMSVHACLTAEYKMRWLWLVPSTVLIVLGLGAYQALASYYIAICILLFVVLLDAWERAGIGTDEMWQRRWNRRMIGGIAILIGQFAAAYLIYSLIANRWFMATADYMGDQMGWGKYPLIDCVKNVLRTAKNVIVGIGPRNFSFYAIAVLLVAALVYALCRQERGERKTTSFYLRILALLGLLAVPFLMTIYMGEMLVTRSQFALPVVSAFLGMYAIAGLREFWRADDRQRKEIPYLLCRVAVVLVLVIQCGYNLRLAYTDEMRMNADVQKTQLLVEQLKAANDGEVPDVPIVFVGYQEAELPVWCRRTEMYGWSYYGWDYSEANPTGATHRIVGFVQAYTGEQLSENATSEQKEQAVELAEGMEDFPAEDSVRVTRNLVVVRLSEVQEQMPVDWW